MAWLKIIDESQSGQTITIDLDGKADDTSKESWENTMNDGVLVTASNVTITGKLARLHAGIEVRGHNVTIQDVQADMMSGDVVQGDGDSVTIKNLTCTNLIEVLPFKRYHPDAIHFRGGKDGLIDGVKVIPSEHKWARENYQGCMFSDAVFYGWTVKNLELPGVHPEHGVTFAEAHDCHVENVKAPVRFRNLNGVDSTNCTVENCCGHVEGASMTHKNDSKSPSGMSVSGVRVLVESEAKRRTKYICQAGHPTIGVGHKLTQSELSSGKIHLSNGSAIDFRNGRPLTDSEIEKLLDDDLKAREKFIEQSIDVPLNQSNYDALVHFVYNTGRTAFSKSTLRRALNKGQYDDVPAQIKRWKYITTASGQKVISNGLVNRRETEVRLWNGQESRSDGFDLSQADPIESQYDLRRPEFSSNDELEGYVLGRMRDSSPQVAELETQTFWGSRTNKSLAFSFGAFVISSLAANGILPDFVANPEVIEWGFNALTTLGMGAAGYYRKIAKKRIE